MRTTVAALAACLAACGPQATQVESMEPVDPIEAPAPVPPIPTEEPEAAADRPPSTSEAVRQRIEELFVLCNGGSFEQAAGYIVYRGEDTHKKWKTVVDYSTDEGKKATHGVCNRVNAYLSASESYSFETFESEEESEGIWYVWEVVFVKGSDREVAYFAFLLVEGVHALGDID
jgi:hypothetical protein